MCSRVDTKQLYLDSVTFSPETVCSTLKKLKPTTSLGPDNIPNVFLKKCANALYAPLAHIFDTFFYIFSFVLLLSIVLTVFFSCILSVLVAFGSFRY